MTGNRTPLGRCRWAIAMPGIPLGGAGPEPEFTSRDTLCLLNAGHETANVRIRVHYPQLPPIGPFRITVAPRRLRRIRINDLIFPEAVRLETPYGLLAYSNQPVLLQLTAQYTCAAAQAWTGARAFADTNA